MQPPLVTAIVNLPRPETSPLFSKTTAADCVLSSLEYDSDKHTHVQDNCQLTGMQGIVCVCVCIKGFEELNK